MTIPSRGAHVAFATSSDWSRLTSEDRWVADCLVDHGVRVTPACWDDSGVDWAAFDAVVLRSCWDYHLRLADFLGWVERLETLGCALWNPPPLVRWNSRKRYLDDLRDRGVETVPTIFLAPGESADLGDLMDRLGADDVVIKPTVAASAYGAWRAVRSRVEDQRERFAAALDERELMVQPLVSEVRTSGEWSLIFFGGKLSHAVNKVPGSGDFRVQEELGGSSTRKTPSSALVAAAYRALRQVEGPTLYARVDLVESRRRAILMELELIEPWLFFETDARSPARFLKALRDVLGEDVS